MDTFKNIKLNGWRQFENVDINFDAHMNVLTGANGSGKTTILNVLARHFGWNVSFITTQFFISRRNRKIWSDLYREIDDNNNDILELENTEDKVGSIEYSNGKICTLHVPKHNSPQYSLNYHNQQGITGINIPSHRPVVNYSPLQSIPTNPKTNQQRHQEFQQLLFQTYGSDHVRNPGHIIKESLISLALFGYGNEYVQPNNEYKKLFEEFQEILRIILPKEIGFNKLIIRVPDIVLDTKTGEFPLDAMSGGVGAVFYMAWQIHSFGADRDGCTVIIDEPENHLHPSMQREYLVRLRDAFPKYKFIVSTHSPFIVSSDPNATVYGLIFLNGKVISHRIEGAELAGSPNKILREILDVPITIPVWVENKIAEVICSFKDSPLEERARNIYSMLESLGLSGSISDIEIK